MAVLIKTNGHSVLVLSKATRKTELLAQLTSYKAKYFFTYRWQEYLTYLCRNSAEPLHSAAKEYMQLDNKG